MAKRKSPTDSAARERLVVFAQRGGITLVIGAGVSIARRVPDWESLARRIWAAAFGRRRSPWEAADATKSPTRVPQFLPIIFELAYRKMGEAEFLEALRENLYSKVRYPGDDKRFKWSNETLAVLARLIVQEHRRGSRRRIKAIITLNCDDLIEQAVNTVAGRAKPRMYEQIVSPVARSTHSLWDGLGRRPPISLYHIHGFVPSNHTIRYQYDYSDMLVFTDAQYWSTSAAGSTFANRIMTSALSESRCVFVGLSMTDLNLLRWFAVRTIETDRELEATRKTATWRRQERFFDLQFRRHFWIRPPSDDPTGFVSDFLSMRGVKSVAIDSWKGSDFQMLMNECFPESPGTGDDLSD
jgi:hypothetical protein